MDLTLDVPCRRVRFAGLLRLRRICRVPHTHCVGKSIHRHGVVPADHLLYGDATPAKRKVVVEKPACILLMRLDGQVHSTGRLVAPSLALTWADRLQTERGDGTTRSDKGLHWPPATNGGEEIQRQTNPRVQMHTVLGGVELLPAYGHLGGRESIVKPT